MDPKTESFIREKAVVLIIIIIIIIILSPTLAVGTIIGAIAGMLVINRRDEDDPVKPQSRQIIEYQLDAQPEDNDDDYPGRVDKFYQTSKVYPINRVYDTYDMLDGDERLVNQSRSRNDPVRQIEKYHKNTRKMASSYLKDEFEEEEYRDWWGRSEM